MHGSGGANPYVGHLERNDSRAPGLVTALKMERMTAHSHPADKAVQAAGYPRPQRDVLTFSDKGIDKLKSFRIFTNTPSMRTAILDEEES